MTFDTIYLHGYSTTDGHRPTLRERLQMRKTCGPYQLTPGDATKRKSIGFYTTSRGLAMGDGSVRLRLELANDQEIGRLSDIRGYYTDQECCDETMKPITARLPHSRGFLAGWTMGGGMCAKLETRVYAEIEEAARAAHSIAEYDANEESDYQAREREKQREEDEAETGGRFVPGHIKLKSRLE